jgi:hypothetical protein
MRVKAIMIRILLQLAHDKRTIGLMILAPILVLTLLSFVFDGSNYHPKIGIINAPLSFVNKLEDNDAKVIRLTENDGDITLKTSEIDALINFEGGIPKITLEGSDPSKSQAVIKLTQNALSLSGLSKIVAPDITYLYGYENMAAFDNYGPILIGFFVFFFVFLIAGVAFLKERTTGTLRKDPCHSTSKMGNYHWLFFWLWLIYNNTICSYCMVFYQYSSYHDGWLIFISSYNYHFNCNGCTNYWNFYISFC